jgi:tellurium resistance protein TerD
MSVKLTKGTGVRLQKGGRNLTTVSARLSWKAPVIPDPKHPDKNIKFDLDASVFSTHGGRATRDEDLIYYYNKTSIDGAIVHSGDDPTGATGEEIKINLPKIGAGVTEIFFAISIDEFLERKQNFGQVLSASMVLIDDESDTEFARYDLVEDFSIATAVVAGSLQLANGEWSFKAIGEPQDNGITGLCDRFGVAHE